MRRLRSKGVVALLGLMAAGLLLASAFRPWVIGAVDDAVLGATRISATGSEVAPGLTPSPSRPAPRSSPSRRRTGHRFVALVAYALCLAAAAALAVRVLVDP